MESTSLRISKLITFYQTYYNIPKRTEATRRLIDDLQTILAYQLKQEAQK